MNDIASALQALIDTEAEVDGAACLLRVGLPEHGLVWRGAAGGISRGGDPADPDTPFRIASITKTFTAAVIVQLAAEGRLCFDDLMADHLPPDQLDLVPRLHIFDGVSYGASITLRQLLTHSSGLFDYAQSDGFIGEIITDPSTVWTPRRMLEGSTVWGQPHFAPDTGYGYAYSDTGYVLLGLVIEHLDGRPLHDAYRARLLDPLGLHGTYLEGFEPHRGAVLAHTHEGVHDTSVIHGTADWAGGGLVSTLDDLATFAQALVDGRVAAPPLLDEMLRFDFRTLDPARHSAGYLGYGFGVEARDSDGFVLRGHRGHWGAWMHVDPRSRLTITGSINQADRRPDRVVKGVTEIIRTGGLVSGGAA